MPAHAGSFSLFKAHAVELSSNSQNVRSGRRGWLVGSRECPKADSNLVAVFPVTSVRSAILSKTRQNKQGEPQKPRQELYSHTHIKKGNFIKLATYLLRKGQTRVGAETRGARQTITNSHN